MRLPFSLDILPPSTNNAYINAPGRGRIKAPALRAFQELAGWSLRRPKEGIAVPCRLVVTFTLADKRACSSRDLDNMLKAIQDALAECGFLKNDNRVYEIQAKKQSGPSDRTAGYLEEL